MDNVRTAGGDAYSTQLFRSRLAGQSHQPGDGNPDFNDGLLTPKGEPYAKSGMIDGWVIRSYPNTMTADVGTDLGVLSGCRIGTPYIGPQGSGYSVVLEPGTNVLVCHAVSPAVIMTCIAEGDVDDTAQDNSKIDAITCGTKGFGGDDPVYVDAGGTNHRNGRSTQLMPGDQMMSATEGNLMGLLRGLTVVKGSELSQLVMSNIGGVVRLISNLYQHFHAAGITQIVNKGGKTTASFKYGATARGNGEVEPVVHITVGAESDLVELLITSEDGEKLARYHLNSQGDLEIEANDVEIEVNKDLELTVDGDASLDIEGNFSQTVKGDQTQTITGKASLEANELSLRAGATGRLQTARDFNMTVGGRYTQQLSGEATVSSSTFTHTANLADIKFLSGARGVAVSGLTLSRTGDIDVTGTRSATIGGKVKTDVTGTIVQLGTATGVSPHLPVIRNQDLTGLVDAIFAYLNAAGTAVSGKIVIPAPPAAANPITAAILTLGSKIVRAS